MSRLFVEVLVGLALTVCACGPSKPTTVTGTWTGTVSDDARSGQVTVVFTQTDSKVSGTYAVVATTDASDPSGTVAGILSGNSLQFSTNLNFPESCTAVQSGIATVSEDFSTITGTYAGKHSCSGIYKNGKITLTRAE